MSTVDRTQQDLASTAAGRDHRARFHGAAGGALLEQVRSLRAREDWREIRELLDELPATHAPRDRWLLDELFMACFYLGDRDGALRAARALEHGAITLHHLRNTDHLLPWLREGRRVVASCDPARRPAPGELVILYGDYPLTFESLVVHNPVRRNLYYFFDHVHDAFESHADWRAVERIYVLNLDHRPERFLETLRELRRAGAPLDRVQRWPGKSTAHPARPDAAPYIGAAESHLAVLRDIERRGLSHALVLEDDFTFCDDVSEHRSTLARFLESRRPYDVCFLSCSETGWTEPVDGGASGLAIPRTACTTASGYLISGAGAPRVAATVEEGLRKLIATGDHGQYAGDRYWTRLASTGRFLCFRPKMGYQRPGWSDTTSRVEFYFD